MRERVIRVPQINVFADVHAENQVFVFKKSENKCANPKKSYWGEGAREGQIV